jgi:hypothetical protein
MLNKEDAVLILSGKIFLDRSYVSYA